MSLCEETYDAEFRSGAQVIRTGAGGRIGRDRRKTEPERRRMKSVRDPETGKVKRVPVEPKARKDVGTPRPASTRTQQPTQERGAARTTQLAAAREERKKAALARIAAKKEGETATTAKPKAKEVEKTATKLLAKKAPAPKPSGDKEDHMIKGSLLPKGENRPYTRDEKKKIVRTGKRLQADIQKGREKPASQYQSSLTGK